jgi:hypothetical protein
VLLAERVGHHPVTVVITNDDGLTQVLTEARSGSKGACAECPEYGATDRSAAPLENWGIDRE